VDVLISVFGVIFAPDPKAAAAETARVLAPGGRAVISAWIPEGTFFAAVKVRRDAIAEVSDEPTGPPPFAWHEADALGELFSEHGMSVSMEEHEIAFEANSARELAEADFRDHPMWSKAREQLDPERVEQVRDRMLLIYEEGNEDPDAFRITSRYVVAELTRTA